jgi:hypothetical protein
MSLGDLMRKVAEMPILAGFKRMVLKQKNPKGLSF